MITEELFSLAFALRKAAPWRQIAEEEICALRLSDGRVGYLSFCPSQGPEVPCGVFLYVDEASLFCRRTRSEGNREEVPCGYGLPLWQRHERRAQLQALSCRFVRQEQMGEEERQELAAYAEAHRLRLPVRCPSFVVHTRRHPARPVTSREEVSLLTQALAAALTLAGDLPVLGKEKLHLQPLGQEKEMLLLMPDREGGFYHSTCATPRQGKVTWPVPAIVSSVSVAAVKKLPHEGVWECALTLWPQLQEPQRENEGQEPFYPACVLCVRQEDGQVLRSPGRGDDEAHPESLLEDFTRMWIARGSVPAQLLSADERTAVFVRRWCRRTGVRLKGSEQLPALLQEQKRVLGELFPREVQEEEEAEAKKRGKRETPEPVQSAARGILISATLQKGCYRHIRLPESASVDDLGEAILQAFFPGTTAHMALFFPDNHPDNRQGALLREKSRERGRGSKTTRQIPLRELCPQAGGRFACAVDYRYNRLFHCRVLRVGVPDVEEIQVTRIVGEADAGGLVPSDL